MKQFFENLPAEIKNSRRFFLVAENKRPLQKDWSNPAFQKSYTEINGLAGFDTSGHGVADNYLFLDFDHVLNAEGDFVNETVSDFFGELVLSFKNLYVEKSISGTGLHVFLKPTAGKFEGITNSDKGVLHFDDGTDKNSPKLELFYGSGGRYCLVTGNLFDCDAGAELIIPSGVEVDEYLTTLLVEIQKQLQERGDLKPARNTENIFTGETEEIIKHVESVDTPAEYKHDLSAALFNHIDGANLERGDWLPVVTALKAEGFTQGEAKAMCQSSSRYNEKNFDKEWQSLTDLAGYGVTTLIGKAHGFDFKKFYAQWYKEHPQYQKAKIDNAESKLAADEKAFEDEKTAAIEYIKNLQTFDAATVTSSETLQAAAFCKIFDLPTFSAQFWGEITKLKVKPISVNDLKAAMKPYIDEITARRDKLNKRRATFDADKKSAAFLANNLTENFKTPYDYEISADGILKFDKTGDSFKICRLPLILAEKIYSLDDKTFSARLAYKSNNKWYYSPAVDLETISNHRKITTLSNHNLPVTSANSYNIVEYLDAFRAENESAIPVTCTVKNCGWRKVNDKEIFIDPRRKLTITDASGVEHNLKVEDSAFTQNLKTAGSLQEWRRVYNLAKKYPVARFVVAACVAAPLLEIFHERNFLIYILSNTTSGKTTALSLGVSAVGNVDGLLRNLDATVNGVAGVAADYNHYALTLDESEVADAHIKDNTKKLVYALANGVSRTKLNSDSTVKELRNWKTIAILTGETEMLEDNVTAGAYIRLMTIDAPAPVLPAELCKDIKNTICTNYGHALPLVIDEIFNQGFETLRELFKLFADTLIKKFPSILPEYCRYVALVTVADILLNTALNKFDKHSAQSDIQSGAITNATEILKLVPKKNEISDAAREQDMISDFISANLNNFVGATEIDIKQIKAIHGLFGKSEYIYITIPAVKIACKSEGFKYKKVVADLTKNKFWEKGSQKILDKITRCYKILKKNVGVEYETDCE